MALTGYEKQKRWREKNRALYNLQQRNRRKKSSDSSKVVEHSCIRVQGSDVGSTPTPKTISIEKKEVGGFKLNMISMPTETVQDEPTMPVVKPKVFRDDFGNQLTEAQWNRWQEIKKDAEQKGFVKDEYSQ